jgi:hypothetical protein
MNRIPRIAVKIGIGIIALFLLFVLYVLWWPQPNYNDVELRDIELSSDPKVLKYGKNLAIMDCYGCHQGADRKLSGGLFEDVQNKE